MENMEKLLLERKNELQEMLRSNSDIRVNKCEIKENVDFASYSSEVSKNDILHRRYMEELNDINYSLNKLKSGEYGICEICDEEINIERLKLKPYAKYCVECKNKIEKGEL